MSSRAWVSIGWWGYFTCALIYVVAGVRAGDWLGTVGSLFFLGATVAFLIPHYRKTYYRKSSGRAEGESEQ